MTGESGADILYLIRIFSEWMIVYGLADKEQLKSRKKIEKEGIG